MAAMKPLASAECALLKTLKKTTQSRQQNDGVQRRTMLLKGNTGAGNAAVVIVFALKPALNTMDVATHLLAPDHTVVLSVGNREIIGAALLCIFGEATRWTWTYTDVYSASTGRSVLSSLKIMHEFTVRSVTSHVPSAEKVSSSFHSYGTIMLCIWIAKTHHTSVGTVSKRVNSASARSQIRNVYASTIKQFTER